MSISYSEGRLSIGSKSYIGECIEKDFLDIGLDTYDTKIYHFPNGIKKSVHCSEPIFCVSGFHTSKKESQTLESAKPDRQDSKPREDNLLRARSRLQQIILNNEWAYFVTLTFNDLKVDASDVALVISKLQKWLNNQTQANGLGYVLVPEFHKKDCRVHCHALVNSALKVVHNGAYKVKGIKKPVLESTIKRYRISDDRLLYPVYNVSNWNNGFSTAIEVYGNPARLANYVLKYMTKDNQKIFGKSYWCSKNIKLYPDVELVSIGREAFESLRSKEYWTRAVGKSFKYGDNLSRSIEDLANSDENEKEVLKL